VGLTNLAVLSRFWVVGSYLPKTRLFVKNNFGMQSMLFEERQIDASYPESVVLAFLQDWLRLTPSRLKLILQTYLSLNEALADDFRLLAKLPKTDWLAKFDRQVLETELPKFYQRLVSQDIQVCSILDVAYPTNLNHLAEPPLVLYYQGNWSVLNQYKWLTVVGSRMPTVYTKKVLQNILEPVCQAGVGVVSGLALGVDTLAHQIALQARSATVGIIGSGLDFDSFYPAENWGLRQQILEQGGLVISEYPPGTEPVSYNFPKRNRLLAALGSVVWVVQAGQKSGSLITASLARDLGKTVATVPGSIYDDSLAGNLNLLRDGANLILEFADLWQLLGLSKYQPVTVNREQPVFNSAEEQLVWQQLSAEPQLLEDLSRRLQMEIQELSQHLTMLELHNLAVCVGENLWVRG
jgi:DNA protecting protein DprA